MSDTHGVTDVTQIPYSRILPMTDKRKAGYTGYNSDSAPNLARAITQPGILPFRSSEELKHYLHRSEEWEAAFQGCTTEEIRIARQKWLERGISETAFLRKWRELNAISIAAFHRLTGIAPKVLRKALKWGDIYRVCEPVTCQPVIHLDAATWSGFTFNQIKAARDGAQVHIISEVLRGRV